MKMKTISSSEIARVLVLTTRAVRARAKRENWPYIEIPGRGSGGKVRHFPIVSLPPEVQAALHGEGSSSFSASVGKPCDAAAVPSLISTDNSINLPASACINKIVDTWKERPQSCRETGRRRLSIVREAREIRNQSGKGKKKALKRLAKQKGISLSTLYKYLQDADQARDSVEANKQYALLAQVEALTPNYGTRSSKSAAFSKGALDYAKLLYGPPNLLSITDVFKRTIQEAERKGWKTGSYESLRRYLHSTVEENVVLEILEQAMATVKWATDLLSKKELKSINAKRVKLRKHEKELF